MLLVHPILAVLIVGLVIDTARFGWHYQQILTVQATGAEVTMLLDGQEVGKASDDGWQTGRVGLGTKADSITRFRAISAVTR